MEQRDLFTVEQAAEYLQVSPGCLRSYIRKGQLKAFRLAGQRKILIPREALLALLEPVQPSQKSEARQQLLDAEPYA